MKKSKPVKKKPVSRRHESAKQTNHPAKGKVKVAPKKAKPVQKAASKVKKTAAKVVKTAKSKKPAPKPVKAPAKKAAAKAPVKKTAKPVKVAPKKVVAPVKAKAKEAVVKAVKAVKAPVVKEASAPVVSRRHEAEKPNQPVKVKAEKLSKADKAKAAAAAAPVEAFPALDPSVKRPAKPFFLEVKPGVERVIKRGDKSAASPVLDIQARRKGPAAEESSEELAERIERELQSQSFLKRNRMRPQLCTKCGINAVAPRFTIDRELGYCDPCAEILHLGETKEARRMEFNLALKKEEGEAGVDEPEEPSPDEVEDVPDVED
jgi:hypothetical protein